MQVYILMIIASLSLISSFYDNFYEENHETKEKNIKNLIEKHMYKEKQKDVFCFDHNSGYIYLDSLYDINKYF